MVKDDLKLLIPERNIVTVETFRNGKLRQRAKTHNMITQPGLDWLKYKRDYGLNTGIAAGKNTHKVPLDVFNTLVALSDSTSPTLGENYTLSDVIAWANKTAYTGTDTKRGTVNLVESYCTDDLIHWAIDFPTHAGNSGVINSIAWEYCNTTTDYIQGETEKNEPLLNILTLNGMTNNELGLPLDITPIFFDNPYIYLVYHANNSNHFDLYKFNIKTGNLISSYTSMQTMSASQGIAGIVVIGDDLFVLKHGAPSTIQIYSLSSQNRISTLNINSTQYTAFSTDGTFLYMCNAPSKTIIKTDFAGNVIASYILDNIGPTVWWLQYLGDNKMLACDNGVSYIYDMTTWTTLQKLYKTNNLDNCIFTDGLDIYSITRNTNPGTVRKVTWDSLGARALLPVPIQKTAADTMRITYDFDIRY